MKKFFLCSLILLGLNVFSQGNLTLKEDGKFIWQNVYDVELTSELKQALIAYIHLENLIMIDDNSFKGEFQVAPDWRKFWIKAGKSPINAAILVRGNDLRGTAVIEIKESKYRITVQDILLVWSGSNTSITTKGDSESIEWYALKNDGTIRGYGTRTPNWLELYDYTISDYFDLVVPDGSDDW